MNGFKRCGIYCVGQKVHLGFSIASYRKTRMNFLANAMYDGILLSHKEGNLTFAATWMDLEIIIQSEVSQTEKDKYCMISLICGI